MVHYQKQRKQGKSLTDIVICDIKTYSLKIYIYFPSILKNEFIKTGYMVVFFVVVVRKKQRMIL